MNIPGTNNLIPSIIASYLTSVIPPADLNHLFIQATELFHSQTKHFIYVTVGLSSIGAAYTALYDKNNYWLFYVSGGLLCLGTAYHQGFLEHALFKAEESLEKIQKSLTLAETALSDRALLLIDLDATKNKLEEVSKVVVTAGINEKNLITELSITKEKQKELSDTVIQLTTIMMFFQNLKNTYPDQKIFLEHLSSIEKVTKATQEHLSQNSTTTATQFIELKKFLENLDKKDIDKMALLLEMHKNITDIKLGVHTANHSLEELKTQKTEVA